MNVSIRYPLAAKQRSLGVSMVMDAFGVLPDEADHVVCENLSLELRPGQVVLFTGPSGSGKSSILRAVSGQLQGLGHTVLDIHALELPAKPLVDALPLEVKASLDLLAACGLSEAQLLLRLPGELSEGQRYRFRLALGCALLKQRTVVAPAWVLADEFSATLDRTLAKVVAFNLGKLVRRMGIGCLLATTHDDIATDLSPDVRVMPDLDGRLAVTRPSVAGLRRISFFPTVVTGRAPVPTGPTSPAGTTAATRSASSAMLNCSGMETSLSGSASSAPRPGPCDSAASTSACTG